METPEQAARRARMVARSKEWISLVATFKRARPNASYGWAEQEARKENPILHAEVYGLAQPWAQPGAEVLSDEQAPRKPQAPRVPALEKWDRPITPADTAPQTRMSTVPKVVTFPKGPAGVATLRERFEDSRRKVAALRDGIAFQERLGVATAEQTAGVPRGYRIVEASDEDGRWFWAYGPNRTIGGFATKQEALVAALTDARRLEALRRAAQSGRPDGPEAA